MEIEPILLLTAFAGGYLVSRWQCRHHLLINLALRAELIDMRRKVHCNESDKTGKVRHTADPGGFPVLHCA